MVRILVGASDLVVVVLIVVVVIDVAVAIPVGVPGIVAIVL